MLEPRRVLRLAAAALAFALSAPAVSRAAAPALYDVSYLWHVDRAAAFARRDAVAKILGPTAAKNLHVVWADGACGVVYLRDANRARAAKVAASHTRLLKCHHLGKAWIVGTRDWTEIAPNPAVVRSVAAAAPVHQRRAARVARSSRIAPAELETARSAEQRRLEGLVAGHVRRLRREGRLSADERTAWSVYDFSTGQTLVEINTDLELQAASLIKPLLALAYMSRVSEGKLVYDARSRLELERMIQHSDNAAADWTMRRLGGPAAVQSLLRRRYGTLLTGVEIKEYIPADGRTYRNKASARDYSRFLLALWRDELPGSEEIKRLMALPKRDRIKTGAPLPDDVQVYSKTGSTSRLCGDIGVLRVKAPDGHEYAYALVGIIEKKRRARHYFRWLRSRGNVIREISGLVYRGIGSLHGFAQAR